MMNASDDIDYLTIEHHISANTRYKQKPVGTSVASSQLSEPPLNYSPSR